MNSYFLSFFHRPWEACCHRVEQISWGSRWSPLSVTSFKRRSVSCLITYRICPSLYPSPKLWIKKYFYTCHLSKPSLDKYLYKSQLSSCSNMNVCKIVMLSWKWKALYWATTIYRSKSRLYFIYTQVSFNS